MHRSGEYLLSHTVNIRCMHLYPSLSHALFTSITLLFGFVSLVPIQMAVLSLIHTRCYVYEILSTNTSIELFIGTKFCFDISFVVHIFPYAQGTHWLWLHYNNSSRVVFISTTTVKIFVKKIHERKRNI